MRTVTCSIVATAALAVGCQQTTNPPPLRSLAQSGSLSVVCRDMVTGLGQDINGCPDPQATTSTGRHTMLMVTQTGRGEVAVIDMTNKTVIDEDPAAPGTEFLPIGAMPVSIASTPGGSATFVATAEPGREAIFVLPTSCVMPPKPGEPARDLTQWSACRLPGVPGEMVILPDETSDPAGGYRKSCEAPSVPQMTDTARADCPSDWEAEERITPLGRRKIVLTLTPPNKQAGLVILDARSLYNLQPGAFDACPIERWLPLSLDVPTSPSQSLPDDLRGLDATCSIANGYYFAPIREPRSVPAGIAFKDGRLYVADKGVPIIHELNLADPCDPRELEPLVPTSIEDPGRAVLTSDVAVSDLTSKRERFVYAVDHERGNLMAFDVSPGATQRTPLVFSGLPYLPFDAPDRINTNLNDARAKDILFVTHDVPIVDEASSTASTGVLCDPTPGAATVGSQYRTSSDYTRGASPSKLRGMFAMVALSDGHVSVIDVEDWDAACRRPIEGNTSSSMNWRGCVNDAASFYIDGSNARTVSDEASCRVVEPHHPRSGRFVASNSAIGTGAPSLPGFPALATPSNQTSSGSSTRSNTPPKLIAAPYPASHGTSEVYISSTRYYLSPGPTVPSGATLLDTSPATADHNSVLLPLVEPRSYLPTENFSLTYEGKLFDDRASGLLGHSDVSLTDLDAQFCDKGVQDRDVAEELAPEYLPAGADKSTFAANHADFVQITADFDDHDAYWSTPIGSSCAADPATGVSGIAGCRSYFGTNGDLKPTRELTVTEAYQDRLVLNPRTSDAVIAANLRCCFPGTVKYTVRAARQWLLRGQQALSRVVAKSGKRCQLDCSPRKQHVRTRAIEITSSDTNCPGGSEACTCSMPTGECIGPAAPDGACVLQNAGATGPGLQVEPNAEGSLPPGCIFDSIKARFVVYAGTAASIRDMAFGWQVTGGFSPYQITLSNSFTGALVMPQSMTAAPNLNAFFVVDGVSGGVFEFVLDPFSLNGNPYL